MDALNTSLDGGWLCDIPVTVPGGELLNVAITVQDAQHAVRCVRDVKRLLVAQHASGGGLPAEAIRLVERAAHGEFGRGSRLTGDVVDRELHDSMSVDELTERVEQKALLYLHVSLPHCWSCSEGELRPSESLDSVPPNFAMQPPPSGRRYVCISNTGKANVRPTPSLGGRLLREINPGDTVAVFEEKMCDGHLRGRISSQSDETSGETEWLSIRTRYGNPLMQAASLEEQAAALEAAALSPQPAARDRPQPSARPAADPPVTAVAEPQGAAGGVDQEFELDFGDDLG